MLSNPLNKANMAHFLLTDWTKQCEESLSPGNEVYLAAGFHDSLLAIHFSLGHHDVAEDLMSDHEEADSRMFMHIAHTTQANNVKRVLLRSIDTDVAAMCPKYCLSCGIEEFYFKTGTGNKKRFILMHLVADRLGEDIAHVLPRLYALSGCDSTSFFSGIGKQRWMTMASAHPDLLKGLKKLGSNAAEMEDETQSACHSLASLLYGGSPTESLDSIRYELFAKKSYSNEKLPQPWMLFSST